MFECDAQYESVSRAHDCTVTFFLPLQAVRRVVKAPPRKGGRGLERRQARSAGVFSHSLAFENVGAI